MKKKLNLNKLSINKQTITVLNKDILNNLKGGATTSCGCPTETQGTTKTCSAGNVTKREGFGGGNM